VSDQGRLPGLPLRRAHLRRIAEHPGLGGTRAALRRQALQFLERLAMLIAAICLLLAAGTAGYVITEGTSVGFGFIWALDTVATVGSIPEPASSAGQIVKVALIVLGVGTLFYALVTVTEFFVSGHLASLLEERRLLKKIDSLSDHVLICGFGRVGRQAAATCGRRGAPSSSSTTTPRRRASTRRRCGLRSSRGRPPTTRFCAAPGSCGRRG
jgi:voltage-gated potassium channel